MTYTGVLATVFTGIEPAVALSLACVPFLRPLVVKRNNLSTGLGSSSSPYASRTLGSKGPSSGSAKRPFEELNDDDSSEDQLRRLGTSTTSDSPKYEAGVGPGSGHKQPTRTEPTGSILVKKAWGVVSGTRPAS